MARCLLALGSNLGDRHTILERCCAEVAALDGCQLLARSRWHPTVPIGGADGQDAFLNGALLVATSLLPAALATALHDIETRLGRERVTRWDARVIDIDMLLYAEAIIDTIDLVVPHPRMGFRSFVLEPAVEIAGEMLHPSSGWTLSRLLAHLQRSPRFVVVAAAEEPIADWIVTHFSNSLGCPVWSSSCADLASDESSTTGEIAAGSGVMRRSGGVEFPGRISGAAPCVATMRPEALAALRTTAEMKAEMKIEVTRPALVIAIDTENLQELRDAARSAKRIAAAPGEISAGAAIAVPQQATTALPDRSTSPRLQAFGLGPLARITAADPATVLQEALAAVRSVWPDIES